MQNHWHRHGPIIQGRPGRPARCCWPAASLPSTVAAAGDGASRRQRISTSSGLRRNKRKRARGTQLHDYMLSKISSCTSCAQLERMVRPWHADMTPLLLSLALRKLAKLAARSQGPSRAEDDRKRGSLGTPGPPTYANAAQVHQLTDFLLAKYIRSIRNHHLSGLHAKALEPDPALETSSPARAMVPGGDAGLLRHDQSAAALDRAGISSSTGPKNKPFSGLSLHNTNDIQSSPSESDASVLLHLGYLKDRTAYQPPAKAVAVLLGRHLEAAAAASPMSISRLVTALVLLFSKDSGEGLQIQSGGFTAAHATQLPHDFTSWLAAWLDILNPRLQSLNAR